MTSSSPRTPPPPLSWVDGISRANKLRKQTERYAIALVGDGALTGGMAWEAVNNIAADKDRKAIIVVNDNGRSYAPTIGGLANQLSGLRQQLDKFRTHPSYEDAMSKLKGKLKDSGAVGTFAYKSLHATKKGIKDWWAPQGLFEDLGLKYIGPIDGHNQRAVEEALLQAKQFGGPVLVHAMTEKGHGYAPAIADVADQFHAVGVIDPETGVPVASGEQRAGPASSVMKLLWSPTNVMTLSQSPVPCCSRWA